MDNEPSCSKGQNDNRPYESYFTLFNQPGFIAGIIDKRNYRQKQTESPAVLSRTALRAHDLSNKQQMSFYCNSFLSHNHYSVKTTRTKLNKTNKFCAPDEKEYFAEQANNVKWNRLRIMFVLQPLVLLGSLLLLEVFHVEPSLSWSYITINHTFFSFIAELMSQ